MLPSLLPVPNQRGKRDWANHTILCEVPLPLALPHLLAWEQRCNTAIFYSRHNWIWNYTKGSWELWLSICNRYHLCQSLRFWLRWIYNNIVVSRAWCRVTRRPLVVLQLPLSPLLVLQRKSTYFVSPASLASDDGYLYPSTRTTKRNTLGAQAQRTMMQ